MFSAAEIAGLKNDLKDFYSNFTRYTTIGSFYQTKKLSQDDKFIKYVLKYVEPGMKVLDVGIGAGLMTLELARISDDVTGIDIASSVIDFASDLKKIEIKRFKLIEDFKKLNYKSDNLEKINYQVEDIENPSFKNKKYDLIVAQDIIEHLPAPIRAITHMVNSLNKGGKMVLIVHTPIIQPNLNIEEWKKDISQMKNKDAVSRMNYNVLKTWFKRNNLKVLESKVIYRNEFLNILTRYLKSYRGAQFIQKYEETVIFVLERTTLLTQQAK